MKGSVNSDSETFSYESWTQTDTNAALLSSVASCSEIQSWNQSLSSNNDKLKDIQRYCEERVKDVQKVNQSSHTLAAFTSIPVLIGFVANLAFNKNAGFRQSFGNGGIDATSYRVFVRRFILGSTATDAITEVLTSNNGGRDCKGLDWILYKYVRCGLVHTSSLVNQQIDSARDVTVKVTHSEKVSHDSPTTIDATALQRQNGQPITVTLVASEFCKWIENAIRLMFIQAVTDTDLATSIIEVFTEETPVIKFEPIPEEGEEDEC